MLFKSLLFASAFAVLASAQTIETSSASSIAPSSTVAETMPPAATQGFDINNVTESTRFSWCLAQRNTCPQICGGAASLNDCNEVDLSYDCVCPNGTVPDSSAYLQTVPYFVCQANYGQCILRNPEDAQGQDQCRTDAQCGTRNATAEALAATAASAAPTASETGDSSATTGASATSATAADNRASMTTYTSGAFAVALMAAFKLLL